MLQLVSVPSERAFLRKALGGETPFIGVESFSNWDETAKRSRLFTVAPSSLEEIQQVMTMMRYLQVKGRCVGSAYSYSDLLPCEDTVLIETKNLRTRFDGDPMELDRVTDTGQPKELTSTGHYTVTGNCCRLAGLFFKQFDKCMEILQQNCCFSPALFQRNNYYFSNATHSLANLHLQFICNSWSIALQTNMTVTAAAGLTIQDLMEFSLDHQVQLVNTPTAFNPQLGGAFSTGTTVSHAQRECFIVCHEISLESWFKIKFYVGFRTAGSAMIHCTYFQH